jgi:ADP-ribose pyrophosphatase YjhB (NUDIX family)
MATIHKVVEYITFERRLLVFEHVGIPGAGVQVVQGTVEDGERLEDAVMREAREETGLLGLTFRSFLGDELMEVRREESREMHRRSFYHLELLGPPSQRWRHYEDHAWDGSPPIEFELYWAPVFVPPELAGGQGEHLCELGRLYADA